MRWSVLVLVLACAPEGSLGRDSIGDSEAAGSTTGVGTSSTGETSSAAITGSTSESTVAGESSTGTSESSSSSSGPVSCEPLGTEDACELCLKSHCCAPWEGCAADETCSCAHDCVIGGGALDACTMSHCPDSAGALMPLLECAHLQCASVCPWAA